MKKNSEKALYFGFQLNNIQGNSRDNKKIIGCQGFVRTEGEKNTWNPGHFQCSKNFLYAMVIVDTCLCTFVKTHKMYNTKNKS